MYFYTRMFRGKLWNDFFRNWNPMRRASWICLFIESIKCRRMPVCENTRPLFRWSVRACAGGWAHVFRAESEVGRPLLKNSHIAERERTRCNPIHPSIPLCLSRDKTLYHQSSKNCSHHRIHGAINELLCSLAADVCDSPFPISDLLIQFLHCYHGGKSNARS